MERNPYLLSVLVISGKERGEAAVCGDYSPHEQKGEAT